MNAITVRATKPDQCESDGQHRNSGPHIHVGSSGYRGTTSASLPKGKSVKTLQWTRCRPLAAEYADLDAGVEVPVVSKRLPGAAGTDDQADRSACDHLITDGRIRTRSGEVRCEQRGVAEGMNRLSLRGHFFLLEREGGCVADQRLVRLSNWSVYASSKSRKRRSERTRVGSCSKSFLPLGRQTLPGTWWQLFAV